MENKTNILELDNSYSTTRRMIKKKPAIVNGLKDKFKSQLFMPNNINRNAEGGLRTTGYFKSNIPDKPLISVITVVFNGEKYLETTINSVIDQTYDNLELIIIDGGSTDETTNIIKKYDDQIDYWISEKDKGIYDAMNKGISCCCGKYILHLGADDYIYRNDLIQEVVSYMNRNQDISAFIGSIIYSDGTIFKGSVNDNLRFKNTVHHQGVFYKLDLFKQYGLYDLSYKILSDFEFNKRVFLLHNAKNMIINLTVAYCRIGGISKVATISRQRENIRLISPWLGYISYVFKKIIKR